MSDVTIGDMVVQGVDAETKFTINSLEGRFNEVPVLIIIDECILCVMLKIRDGHEPPTEEHQWSKVEVGKRFDSREEEVVNSSSPCDNVNGTDDAFN